ncbi:XRE family transcriptional regulator [Burkholderia sp. L27(2015)]|uniref:XRE family transcriptional regulator n=1 Tax=Burkholderia sp. L27(2015) TaxID=1641858 RepID=UPI00131E81A2|nr:XRE family transcriptional regulator [Burkholderia sp. L27(2015)]
MKQPLVTATQLARVLQSARRSADLTQADVAIRLGIGQSRMSELERHPDTITVDQLLSLVAALGLELIIQTRDAASAASSTVEW